MSRITKKAKPAILICAHGSRSPEAAAEFDLLLTGLKEKNPEQVIKGAFLEFNSPSIPKALQALYDQGHREIIVQPLTLYDAGHSLNDIPAILAEFSQKYPDIDLRYGSSLGLSRKVREAAIAAIKSILPENTDPEDCKLLVVGRGSDDRAVTDQTITLCQKLHTHFGFGDSSYCYSFETTPLLPQALKQAAHSHYSHIIILPYLLFSGKLLSDIHQEIDNIAPKYPEFTFLKAPPLGQQQEMTKAIIQKIQEL